MNGLLELVLLSVSNWELALLDEPDSGMDSNGKLLLKKFILESKKNSVSTDFDKTKIGASVAVATVTNAAAALTLLDNAISLVSTRRGELGALSNRLSSTIANLDNISVNLSSARGRIQDTDFAQETSNLAKNQIMQQAATAMLAQANASKGSILTLIQG